MERRMRPIAHTPRVTVLDRIEVNVVDVARTVVFIVRIR
jgi:hypothetical protein